jgi:hypothetical protein
LRKRDDQKLREYMISANGAELIEIFQIEENNYVSDGKDTRRPLASPEAALDAMWKRIFKLIADDYEYRGSADVYGTGTHRLHRKDDRYSFVITGTTVNEDHAGKLTSKKLANLDKAQDFLRARLVELVTDGYRYTPPSREDKAATKPAAKRSKPSAKPGKPSALLPPKQLARLKSLIDAADLSHRASEILALAKPTVTFSAKASKAAPKQVVSRIGGVPDLAPGTKWPQHDGQPLQFVAQLTAADIAKYDTAKLVPAKTSHLAIFAQLDCTRPDYCDKVAVIAVGSQSVRTDGPARLDKVALLRPSVKASLPYYEDREVGALGLTEDESARYHDDIYIAVASDAEHAAFGHGSAGTRYSLAKKPFIAQLAPEDAVGWEEGDCQVLRIYAAPSLAKAVCCLDEA